MAPPALHPRGEMGTGLVTQLRVEDSGPCPVLWQTPIGPIWGRANDESLLEFLIAEQLIDGVYRHEPVAVEAGDVVLDIGGHLGTFTRHALYRGAKLVVAFEPEPTNIECFKRTFEQEMQDQRVVLIEAAAWDSDGTVHFLLEGTANTGTGQVIESGSLQVRAATIDGTIEHLGLDHVDFIKMDIEGSERNALAGARRTLARDAPRMALCIYHREDDRQVVPQLVLAAQPDYHIIESLNQAYFY